MKYLIRTKINNNADDDIIIKMKCYVQYIHKSKSSLNGYGRVSSIVWYYK